MLSKRLFMHSTVVRKKFIDFFRSKGHEIVSSSSLVPKDDPTLLFTTAGMVQFKELFTGQTIREYKKAATIQKCIRVGGKHNDLENVGKTSRHQTFFEMLGNFSFGDYFKEEACVFAWEFLTETLKIDPSKLLVTVFGGSAHLEPDMETENIWKNIGIHPDKIIRKGLRDNFWSVGETGPCGPCTEIHYKLPQSKNNKMIEFWNLVFVQYERKKNGTLTRLATPSIDTGMGLERLCMLLCNFKSNYETDLLKTLIDTCASESKIKYSNSNLPNNVSVRILADHSRAISFMIADGVSPSNEGRGYVLRRIIRRAVHHSEKLGLKELFLCKLSKIVVNQYKETYSELDAAKTLIEKTIIQEEEGFRRTLINGLELFKKTINLPNKSIVNNELDGAIVFKLYETYGFPVDLTSIMAQENNLKINWKLFEAAKTKHEQSSGRDLGLLKIADVFKNLTKRFKPTFFDDRPVMSVEVEEIIDDELLLDKTPFYAESGGQIGDIGVLKGPNFEARVIDTRKIFGFHLHKIIIISGNVEIGSKLEATVDWKRRESIRRNHSATHLLHSALRQKFGEHIVQRGSLITQNRLRFDFSHFEQITDEQIVEIETQINNWILTNEPVSIETISKESAKLQGAIALFGEKYGESVRMVKVGQYSLELCTGTHVFRTGDIGLFKIINKHTVSSGIYRIEATTGNTSLENIQKIHTFINNISLKFHTKPDNLEQQLLLIHAELVETKKQLSRFKDKELSHLASVAISEVRSINGIKIVVKKIDNMEPELIKKYIDEIRNHLKSGIVVLGFKTSKICNLTISITEDLTNRFHAGKIVSQLAKILNGNGGGSSNFAQAGGKFPNQLDKALEQFEKVLTSN